MSSTIDRGPRDRDADAADRPAVVRRSALPPGGVSGFLAGTRIETPAGETPVESLRPGHPIRTAEGRILPVRQVGRQAMVTRLADPWAGLPIRLAAGALGAGLPRRDLLVCADHGLLLDGLLVQAGALVGLPGITRATPAAATFTWWHVGLLEHALLVAEGVAAESFLDPAAGRRLHAVGHGVAPPAPSLPLPYPRVRAAPQLPPRWRDGLGVIGAAA